MNNEMLRLAEILFIGGLVAGIAVIIARYFSKLHLDGAGETGKLVVNLSASLTRANAKIDALEGKLKQAEMEIASLRTEIELLQELLENKPDAPKAESTAPRPAKPLLLVMCNRLFGEDDAKAIRRTKITFHRLKDATSVDFDRYLQACREDGTTPWWVQISAHMGPVSAHMGPVGIQFMDDVKDTAWLSQRIRGVRVLVLAGCENEAVAAQLVGLVKHVIMVYEGIDTMNAQDFSYAFWSRIESGPEVAFAEALQECPQVSEFVQMRTARGPDNA